jgi:hypothetical protein
MSVRGITVPWRPTKRDGGSTLEEIGASECEPVIVL